LEEQYLDLDSNGYPKTLNAVNEPKAQQFKYVGTLLNRNLPDTPSGPYPAGQYIVLYDGEGTIEYHFDAAQNTALSAPGRDVINVTPSSGGGIYLVITSTDPNHTGNYIRNIRVVQSSYEAALKAGQVFNPAFLAILQNFRALRFMDWLQTNNSPLSSWADRPLMTNAFFGTSTGVPIELAVQLANTVGADAWLHVPHMADNNYITQMANLVHTQLGSKQRVYLEYTNESWNGVFSQTSWIQQQGNAMWPNTPNPFQNNRDWYGMRVAQMCDIWKTAWGADAGRVTCIMSGQAANNYIAAEALDCPLWTAGVPCSGHGMGAIAIAPYFGSQPYSNNGSFVLPIPSAWLSQSDGGLSSLFASMTSQNDPVIPKGGWLGQASGWEVLHTSGLKKYNLPIIAYEAGPGFASFPDGANTALTDLFIKANRDDGMATAYNTYLQQWKANGGELLMVFADVGQYSEYGEWGVLESIMQPVTPLDKAPPKWRAIQDFISSTPCWWLHCADTP
jgi:hypothetical protein